MTGESAPDRLSRLILAIQKHAEFGHPVDSFRLVETHISHVLLTGRFAYKFKKPLDLGFLDFTTLEKRKFYCEEEVRLNRRFAPQLYLDVVAITGTENQPELNGGGEVLEYAVKMVQFPEGSELDKVLDAGRLTPGHMDELARQISSFHEKAGKVSGGSHFGTPDVIRQSALDNFSAIRPLLQEQEARSQLDQLEQWTVEMLGQLETCFSSRREEGYVRECHGDLHLGNIALYEGRPVLFDCIEFSEDFRWIDVMNEIAFLVMDLDARGQSGLARRLLNAYLEEGGDYAGLQVLRFYCVYRALVRCKIACIRLAQNDLPRLQRRQKTQQAFHYLELAENYTRQQRIALMITHGLSGSGKTTSTQSLLENCEAIRIRSDVERKRLHGLASRARTSSELRSGIYTADSTDATYQRLLELAQVILKTGYTVIVDATFLQRDLRAKFRHLADDYNLPFIILEFQAAEDILRKRIQERERTDHDATEAGPDVLEYQLQHRDPLDETEINNAVVFDASRERDRGQLEKQFKKITQASGINVFDP